MDRQIRIPIPGPDEAKVDLIAYFQELANLDEGHEFVQALDLHPLEDDSRVCVDGVEVTDISDHGDEISIIYDVSFFAYYGCQDIDGSSVDDGRHITGRRDGDFWVFEPHQEPERLAPDEEL